MIVVPNDSRSNGVGDRSPLLEWKVIRLWDLWLTDWRFLPYDNRSRYRPAFKPDDETLNGARRFEYGPKWRRCYFLSWGPRWNIHSDKSAPDHSHCFEYRPNKSLTVKYYNFSQPFIQHGSVIPGVWWYNQKRTQSCRIEKVRFSRPFGI